jgi:hypothetical protein
MNALQAVWDYVDYRADEASYAPSENPTLDRLAPAACNAVSLYHSSAGQA